MLAVCRLSVSDKEGIMIQTKAELQAYMQRDMAFYYAMSRRERFMCWLLKDPIYAIAKYIRCLRKEEYYFNANRGLYGKLAYLYYLRQKNRLGNELGFKIPRNCFGPGLTIYHHGGIIVNEAAKIGADCKLHGDNCIGNNGTTCDVPQIGDGLDMGVGAKIIGNVRLGDHVTVGANAVVTRSSGRNGITLIGIPAREK